MVRTEKKVIARIVGLRKLHNSKMGNPKFTVRLYTPDEIFEAKTAENAGFAYALCNWYMHKWARITLKGKTITDIALE